MSRAISDILLLSAVLLVVLLAPLIFVNNSLAQSDNLNIHERVDALEETIERLEVKLSDANETIDGLMEVQAELEEEVRTLQLDFLPFGNLLSCIKFESGVMDKVPGPHVIIEGCNLHVRSGGEIDGRGNLIIGPNTAHSDDVRTGSNFLVIGNENQWKGSGGLIASFDSSISSEDLAGIHVPVIIGGRENTVRDSGVIAGGWENEIMGLATPPAVIINGLRNTIPANVDGGTIIGGEANQVRSTYSTILGGELNQTLGSHSIVLGGYHNLTEIETEYSTVVGGFENETLDDYATVCGGRLNVASGEHSTVSGGQLNTASGDSSSVSGGVANIASGDSSAVSGGSTNIASGPNSCVGGGVGGIASGISSSLSGGNNRSAIGTFDWVAGGLFQDF